MRLQPLSVAALCLGLAAPGAPATLELTHQAIERVLTTSVLVPNGRLYLDGDAQNECRHAFVQNPRLDSVGERLRVTFLFSGRQAARVAGRCVGPGGTFDIKLSGVPVYADGIIQLDGLRLEGPGAGQAFFHLVSGLVERELAAHLRYPLADVLGHAAHQMSTQFGVALSFDQLQVQAIEVAERSVRVTLDLDATAR